DRQRIGRGRRSTATASGNRAGAPGGVARGSLFGGGGGAGVAGRAGPSGPPEQVAPREVVPDPGGTATARLSAAPADLAGVRPAGRRDADRRGGACGRFCGPEPSDSPFQVLPGTHTGRLCAGGATGSRPEASGC